MTITIRNGGRQWYPEGAYCEYADEAGVFMTAEFASLAAALKTAVAAGGTIRLVVSL